MGKVLTMKELMKKAVEKDMPLGVTEAVFEKIDYRIDPEDEESILGVFVHFDNFKSIYLPFTEGEVNYQLAYLMEQLGLETYDPREVNKTAGTIVKVSRYLKETERVMSETEYKEYLKRFDGVPPAYIEITECDDGSKVIKNTFTNTNFNIKTIKE